ncbi:MULTISPECIES: TetR family transcriptional regulator [Marinobacter]|jgi:AcrR family transcriptional regulator|uniref:TetR family transcriptional regulator n=1 Tax=Marinobacter nauticus TaxID=2743 RepID=A0A368V5G3_MARNT|nr:MULTISPECIES: TetR family transcriptional regulator [Marinobacter]MEC7433357.1 TetR family transcriptional regulator [Pseudomonadota bacterium]MBY6194906.1 TetR family transcriptional regulator [Marinobacter nauticus]MBY6216054.1 TetR family transcriptional regulator [Marinobacter nauticus]MBY6220491.1 TetR family transcriptional regulator [Marinobacter nauticus]MCA0913490.1 TetR family transcriptional regulator [Marinobacter nauticus]
MQRLAGGKLKLVQAALRLITQSRSLTSLGLRELAREAGLNPNTFYRHFRNLDEFGLQVLGYIAEDMKAGVRQLRQMADSSEQASHDTVTFVYHYFLANPAATTVAVRELHGPSPVLRRALEAQLDASAREMAEDILERGLVPGVDEVVVQEISNMTIRYILFRAMDYIEKPEQRERIQVETERFINRQFRGALIEELDSGQILALKQAPAAD